MTKQDLREYRHLMREVRHLDQQIEEWRSRAERSTRAPDKPAAVGGRTDSLPYIMDKIIKCERAQAGKLKKLKDIEKLLESLPAKESLLMRLYYVDGLSWFSVAEIMGYSTQRIYQLHGRALEKIKDNA